MTLAELNAISSVTLVEQGRLEALENNYLEGYTGFGVLCNKI